MAGLFLIVVVVAVIVTIHQINAPPRSDFVYEASTEVDPASGEEIYTSNAEPEGEPGILYIGFADIINSGFTIDQFSLFKTIVETYASARMDVPLDRVSFKSNSLDFPAPNVFQFEVVLNIDQENLIVNFDASRSPATTGNISITFMKNGQQVWIF